MESWFLVLMRFFLRVDDVVFRVMDTRVFHVFGSNEVLKEVVVREAPYDLMSQVSSLISFIIYPNEQYTNSI